MSAPESKNNGLGAVIAACQNRLRAFVRKRLPKSADVDDIVQEVLYQYVRVNSLLQPVEQASAWMMKVAKNEIIDLSRKKTEMQLPEYAADEAEWLPDDTLADIMLGQPESPEDEYLASLFWLELEEALLELPPAQREAFEMTELKGYSFKQLSEESGVPVNTLISRKHTAVLHLRERLQVLYEDILLN
ncbi:sigma-70 family RNA polymerase sigma factor [Desulfovibrio sp. OttesenSCG-928-F07]|nr:sigma-70 family RNA polymerase sigma factor [Desulfovibrio sp. OttesenSCG-928-F07]